MKNYTYETCCVDSKAEWIDDMIDKAIDITYQTIKKHIKGLDEWEKSMGYVTGNKKGLKLKNDYAVTFHRSKYRNKKCYYIKHSAIEFIFTER